MKRRPTPGRSGCSELRGEPIRLLVLANKAHGLAPGQRFRFEQWAPRLERDHNIKLDLVPFESAELSRILYRRGHVARKAWLVLKDFLARSRCVEAVRDYDAVLVFREAALIGPAIYENLIARSGVPMIFDFDDAIWMHQPTSGVFSRLHFLGKTKTICRMASAVTAGNSYLAAFAAQFNDDVSVVPTTIELSDYPVVPEPPQDPAFIVCWTGSTWTLPHFEQARAALERILAFVTNDPPEGFTVAADHIAIWAREGLAAIEGVSRDPKEPPFKRAPCVHGNPCRESQCVEYGRYDRDRPFPGVSRDH